MQPPFLSGPSHVPASPSHALICLHGFGADGHDLFALAQPLKQALGKVAETLAVFAPHAPAPTPMGQGYQWFSDRGWTFRDPVGLSFTAKRLQAYLNHITDETGIPHNNMVLLGFSQGAMTLLHALPQLPAPAALISCSGALTVPPEIPADAPRIPMLFLHGAEDDVLPADASVAAEAFYREHGYPTQLEILPHLGHGIGPQSLAHIAVFLQEILTPQA